MADQHPPSCAKALRVRATEEGWDPARTVDEIHHCCAVTRLRAHRLARGWTLRIAVEEARQLITGMPNAPKLDEDQLGSWETRPDRRPRAGTIDLLCQLYSSHAQGLGFTGDYRNSDHPVPATGAPRREAQRELTAAKCIERAAEEARRRVDRTLARGTVTPAQLDAMDERLIGLRHEYLYAPPAPMLRALLAELDEVQELAAERQSATTQKRLSEMIALLATMVADALMKLGALRDSRAWYATAKTSADDSGTTELRVLVRAQAAMLPYYYGPLPSAVGLAREARLLSRHRPTPMGVLAAAAEARALARLGDAAGAQQAVRIASADFERCEQGPVNDAFAFPERRLLLYLSGAYTFLGLTRQARDVQQRALRLYPERTGIDPALLRIEEAIGLAQDRSLTEACQLATATYLGLPEEQRTPILGARAQHIIDVLPPAMRSARAARELGEVLALPAS